MIAKTSNNMPVLYLYNNNWQVLEEYKSYTDSYRDYVYGNYIDEVLMAKEDSNKYYYVQDHLYSPVALINNGGSVIERYEYDAYGDCNMMDVSYAHRASSSYGNRIGFTGRELNVFDGGALKNYHYRHRDLSSSMGRFYSEDPLGINPAGKITNPFKILNQYSDGLDLYEYVGNNPIINVDPNGLFSIFPPPSGPLVSYNDSSTYEGIKRRLQKICENYDFKKCCKVGECYPSIAKSNCKIEASNMARNYYDKLKACKTA